MFKKFVSLFEKANLALGYTSLTAIGFGALLTFGGLGFRHLSKAGIEIIQEEHAEQIANIGISAATFGLFGYASAVGLAYGSVEIPELIASCTYASQVKRKKSQKSQERLDCDGEKPVVFRPAHEVPSLAENEIYLYKIIIIKGYEHYGLSVGRIEEKPTCKLVIYDNLCESQIDSLSEIFDEIDRDELVGKAFSSRQVSPFDAVNEYIEAQRNFDASERQICSGCLNYYGRNEIVCGLYPYGWNESSYCPDKKVDSQLVYQEYEREEVIEHLNQQIKPSKAFIQKYDDGTLMIWDDHTNRRFKFDWSGFLIGDDKINGLASLLSYVSYFASRQIVEQDFSDYIDKFNEDLKGIATVQLSDVGISVKVIANESINSYLTRVYRFRLDGIPLYPYESIVFEEIKHNYNLLTLVGYLKVKSIHQFPQTS